MQGFKIPNSKLVYYILHARFKEGEVSKFFFPNLSISQFQRFHNVILPETLHFLPRIEVTLPPDFRCFSCIGILESFLIVAVLCQSATGVRPCMSAVICHLNLNETHGSCDVTFSSSICTHPTPLPLPDLAASVQNSRNSTLFTHSNVQFHLTFAISAPRPSSPPYPPIY